MKDIRNDMIDAFNSTSRYLDDLLNIDNIRVFLRKTSIILTLNRWFEEYIPLFIMIQFLQKYMLNGVILILILLISRILMVMSLGVPLMMYICQLVCFSRASPHESDFKRRRKKLTTQLLEQGFRYHKLRRAFYNFLRIHYDLIEKYHATLKKRM